MRLVFPSPSRGASRVLRLVGRLVVSVLFVRRLIASSCYGCHHSIPSSVIVHQDGMSRRYWDVRLVKAMGPSRCFFSFAPSYRISSFRPSARLRLAVGRFVSLIVSSRQGVRRGALSLFIFIRAVFVSSVSCRFLIAIVKGGGERLFICNHRRRTGRDTQTAGRMRRHDAL